MRKELMSRICFLVLLPCSFVWAGEVSSEESFPFPVKTKIRVLGYDDHSRTYRVESVRFPGEGESYVREKELLSSIKDLKKIKGLDKFRLKLRPGLLVRNEVILSKKLPTLLLSKIKVQKKFRKPSSLKKRKRNFRKSKSTKSY